MPEETEQTPTPRPFRRRPGRPRNVVEYLAPEDAKQVIQALVEEIAGGKRSKPLDPEAQASADQQFRSQLERQHNEPHFWVTFHKNGEEDKVEQVEIGAAGVMYYCRKGQRVLLPQSALNCLIYAVRDGLDHGNPARINGRKYLKRIKEPRFNYTVEPSVISPAEAAEIRMKSQRQVLEAQDLVPLDGGNPMEDLQEIGAE